MPIVTLDVFHTGLEMRFPETRFDDTLLLDKIKEKLMMQTGTDPMNMELLLINYSGESITISKEICSSKNLSDFKVESGWTLQVTDTDASSLVATPALLGLDTVAPKYNSTKRDAGFADFMSTKKKKAIPKKRVPATDDTGKDAAEKLTVGMLVKTKSGAYGCVRFIGKVDVLPLGYWAGVELETPDGRNSGEVKGCKLFECQEMHGMVCRPDDLTIRNADDEEEL